MRKLVLISLLALACLLPKTASAQPEIDEVRLLNDVRVLAADSLQGRRTGSPGSLKAQAYLTAAFQQAGLKPFAGNYRVPFSFTAKREGKTYTNAANLVGYLDGGAEADRYVVISAHYDHLGVRNGKIYNGADDNASGVAAMLAAARYFAAHPPVHSLIFAAFDAEELGLQGAKAFVASPPVPRDAIVLNINLDMVSHNDRNELYASGTAHYPWLRRPVEAAGRGASIKILFGHDKARKGYGDDWTFSSDHAAFHRAKIPFIYFGVEDHADYHKPSDRFDTINPGFFLQATKFLISAIAEFDRSL